MDDPIEVNRRRWDEMAVLHIDTYRIDDVDSNKVHDPLKRLEATELGSVAGLRICHLQCHIGGDAFALARLGAAEVIGVDFSPVSIEIANRRAERLGLADRVSFVCATVEEAASQLGGSFDGIYNTWGVLCWLPSITDWARSVAELLKPGGWLYLADTHPYAQAVRTPGVPYGGGAPLFDDSQGDYTSDEAVFEHPESWTFSHGLGEVVTALAAAGLRVDWLHEHPMLPWHLNDAARLRRGEDGMWRDPDADHPLSFSLRATRPA